MIIASEKDYSEIPNGTILKLIQIGDGWDEACGNSFNVIKSDNNLYLLTKNKNYWGFNEKDMKDYEFILVKARVE